MRWNVLERVAHLALLVSCVVWTARVIASYHMQPAAATPGSAYHEGSRITNTAALALARSPMTVMLVTRSSCPYCTASMPFYRRLVAAAHARNARVLAVTFEPAAQNGQYLASHGVVVDGVVEALANKITVSQTPTVIVVRSDGTVTNSWTGLLSSGGEDAILSTLGRVRSSTRLEQGRRPDLADAGPWSNGR